VHQRISLFLKKERGSGKGKNFFSREKKFFPFPEITSPFKEQSVFQKGIFPAEPFGDSFGKKQLKGRSLFHPAEHDC
jgi:hypothetical protein